MIYTPKVKFNAALNASGDIVPGSAFLGFETSTLGSASFGRYHVLVEDLTANRWEICRYDPSLASGSRRVVLYAGSSGSLTVPNAAVVCSFVAHPYAYVLNTHTQVEGYAPTAESARCMVLGAGASTGADSADSVNISGAVTSSPSSVVVGGSVQGARTTAIGRESSASERYNNGTSQTYDRGGSVAIGYRAESTAAGEVTLGCAEIPHMSGVPLMTDNPSGGGTFTFRAVKLYNGSTFELADILSNTGSYLPGDGGGGGNDFGNWVVHVQGIIVARADVAANNKVVKVEWVTGGALAQTVLTQGANNIGLGLALSGMLLTATVSATAGLKLSGYLHLTKITW